MKRNPETLALAMDYAAAMESCAAYVAVKGPAIREPEAAFRLLRTIMDAATSGNAQESFFIIARHQEQSHRRAQGMRARFARFLPRFSPRNIP